MLDIRQGIRTRYCGPTNIRGSRVQAKCRAKTLYFRWDDSKSVDENHQWAAENLFNYMGWNTKGKIKLKACEFFNDYYWMGVK